MKRKLFIVLLAILSSFTLLFAFSACSDDQTVMEIQYYVGDSLYTESSYYLAGPVKDGYTFSGWVYKDENGIYHPFTREDYSSNTPNHTTEQLVVYATYTINIYTVTFLIDGESVSQQKYTVENKDIIYPALPQKNGYNVDWEEKEISFGDVAINAVYTPIEYTITYLNTEGADTSALQTSYTVETPTFALDRSITKPGMELSRWNDENGNPVNEIATGSCGDRTLTAVWSLATYTISYENTNNYDISGFTSSYTIESPTINLPEINLPGYTFNGWILNENRVTSIPKGSYGNITLTADLVPDAYTITLYPNGGSVSNTTLTVNYGASFTLPIPSYAGMNFEGWYTGDSTSAERYTDSNGNSVSEYALLQNISLYARWTEQYFTVTYETNGGSTVASKSVRYGTAFAEEITTRADYIFEGWYSQDENTKYTSSTVVTSDLTVYAKWIQSTPISTAE